MELYTLPQNNSVLNREEPGKLAKALAPTPLGATAGGKNWCLKALNPCDGTISSARMPGGARLPTVAKQANTSVTFNPATSNGNWDLKLYISRNPYAPVYATRHDSSGAIVGVGLLTCNVDDGFTLTQAAPTTSGIPSLRGLATAAAESYAKRCNAWRLTAQSVTCELVAPQLEDQGTITCAQYDVASSIFSWQTPRTGHVNGDSCSIDGEFAHNVKIFQDDIRNNESVLAMGVTPYRGPARDGVYAPSKLSDFSFNSTVDWMEFMPSGTPGSYPAELSNFVYGVSTTCSQDTVVSSPSWPFGDTRMTQGLNWKDGTVTTVIFRGISKNANVRLSYYSSIEMMVDPASTYSAFAQKPLPPDWFAFQMYLQIAGSIPDGYPADWNRFEKLKELIIKISKELVPFIDPAMRILGSVFPSVAPITSSLGAPLTAAAKAAIQRGEAAWFPPDRSISQEKRPRSLTDLLKGENPKELNRQKRFRE